MAKQTQAKKAVVQPRDVQQRRQSLISERYYALIIFAFSFLIYFNSVFNDYNLDDELVTQNHRLTSQGISAIPEIFKSPYYADKAGYKYEYRPIVFVSFAIEHTLFGESPLGSHLINVLLYALMCVLLYQILKRLLAGYNLLLPFIITLVFAAHPIHTEVVASIKNRDEELALIFGLLSLWAALLFSDRVEQVNNGDKFSLHALRIISSAVAIPLFFVTGILSKSTTITFVLLTPLTLIFFRNYKVTTLLVVTSLLIIPAVFFSRGYSIAQQIQLFTLMYVAVLGLYALKNTKHTLQAITQFFKNAYTGVFGKREVSLNFDDAGIVSSNLDYSVYRRLNTIVPFVIAGLLLFVISALGIKWGFRVVFVPGLLAIGVLYIFVRNELKALLIIPITLLLLQLVLALVIKTTIVEAILIAFIGIQILSNYKAIRWLGVISFIIYAAVVGLFLHHFFFVAILAFAGVLNKRLWPATIAIVLAMVVFGVRKLLHASSGNVIESLNLLAYLVICVSVLAAWKQKGELFNKAALLVIPLVALFYFDGINYYTDESVVPDIKHAYIRVNNTQSIDPTPVKSVRPLRFMEYPLQPNEALRIKGGTAMVVLGHYLRLIICPYPMSFYYGYSYIQATDILNFIPILVLVIHLLLFLGAMYFINRNNLLAFGILFYLAAISAFSGLALPIPGMLGDRFLLIPSIGFVFAMVGVAQVLLRVDFKNRALTIYNLVKPLKVSLAVILIAYSSITVARNFDWKDRITLFSKDIKAVENSAQAQNLLALHLFIASNNENDFNKQLALRQQAIPHFRKAIEVYPDFLNASYDLGRTYEAMANNFLANKNNNMAAAYYDSAYSQYLVTVHMDTTFVTPYYKMGLICEQLADLMPTKAPELTLQAITYYEKYITKFPKQKEVYANLSFAYFKLHQYNKSIDVNRRLLIEIPNSYEPVVNIAKTYLQAGQRDSAYVYFEKAYEINNTNASLTKLLYDLSVELKNNEKADFYRKRL